MQYAVLTAWVGGFFLFIIITYAVKWGVKDALDEFKEEIVKEFDLKKVVETEEKNEV